LYKIFKIEAIDLPILMNVEWNVYLIHDYRYVPKINLKCTYLVCEVLSKRTARNKVVSEPNSDIRWFTLWRINVNRFLK